MRLIGKLLISVASAASVQLSWAAEVSIQSEPAFKGKIGVSATESIPHWPQPVQAPKDAPNVIVILLDDMGFADTSTFGGAAQTPELDRLASRGLRYTNFHTVGSCSPTRAALLSGRNHHRVGYGENRAGGYPGYNTIWKDTVAPVAEVLRRHGYRTAAFGKWHNTPDWEVTPSGPFDRWPTGKGFEYFYGFMLGMDDHWAPNYLYRNTVPLAAPATPQQGYHLTTDLTDEAIRWVAQHKARSPEKPYFLYFATGAVHAPHHVPREWADQYRGQFDQGWDHLRAEIFQRQKQLGVIPKNTQLTSAPEEMRDWASLSKDQKKLYARQMEVYAGFISHTDHELGRLLTEVQSGPAGANTLVLYMVGDNGASVEGGPDGYDPGATTVAERLQRLAKWGSPDIPVNHYAGEWGWAGNTPFQYWKVIASHFGGVRNPLVVSWPARITDRGGLRSQFTHVIDVAATLYDVIGIALPEKVNGVQQQPLDGVSFARTFNDPKAPAARQTQYFEHRGSRAIYHEGWVAAARHDGRGDDYSADRWELYHVAEDFSEARDLALQRPDKLRALQALFDQEASRNEVYPLGGGGASTGRPSATEGRKEFIFLPSEERIPMANVPSFGMSYRLSADVILPESGAEGVLATFGNQDHGFAWYIKDGFVVYENHAGIHHERITSRVSLPHGKVQLAYEFRRDSPVFAPANSMWEPVAGMGLLYVNGERVAEKRLPAVQLWSWGSPALYIGRTAGSTVSPAFTLPFSFTGTLESVTLRLQ